MAELKFDRPVTFNLKPPFPKNMLLELTNVCNHKCIFCGFSKMRRPYGRCDKNFMFDIMEQAYNNGTREIGFYMIGEPLACVDIEDYIKKASQLGFTYIYLTTNGALADIARMKILLKNGLNSVKFSVNAATEKTYTHIHGRSDYEIVKRNIYDLCSYIKNNKLNVSVFISFVQNEINKEEVSLLNEQFNDYVDNIYIYTCINMGGEMLNSEEIGTIEPGGGIPCDRLFNCLHITYEGFLDACCSDINNYLAVEDLHQISLKDAWHSDRMIELRRQHLNGCLSNNMCYRCVYNEDIEAEPLNSLLSY